jgi:hypothetical protein
LKVFAEWCGINGPVKFDINRDFFPVPMDAPTLMALVAAWQSGGISGETLFENLKEGEIIASDRTFEQEQAKIANAPPVSSTIATQGIAVRAKQAPIDGAIA